MLKNALKNSNLFSNVFQFCISICANKQSFNANVLVLLFEFSEKHYQFSDSLCFRFFNKKNSAEYNVV